MLSFLEKVILLSLTVFALCFQLSKKLSKLLLLLFFSITQKAKTGQKPFCREKKSLVEFCQVIELTSESCLFVAWEMKNFNWEKSTHLRQGQAEASSWINFTLKKTRFLRWIIYLILGIPLPLKSWSFGVPRWTEMIPTEFLHNFPEATGTPLILPKAIGPGSHGERNSQVMPSHIGRASPHAQGVPSITLVPIQIQLLL